LVPSPSVTPPALLICSSAAFSAASLLDAEDAHDTRLGTEPGDLDRALLSLGG